MDRARFEQLLLGALEHEMGGVEVYRAALECAQNEELKEEWEKYLEETKEHVEVLTRVAEVFGIDPQRELPARKIVRGLGQALVAAMRDAQEAGDPGAAQVVAAECVVLAETKDHLDWELMGECLEVLSGEEKKALQEAWEQVEPEEDEHLYHSAGWCRELWMESLGLNAVLPPPEEQKDVHTAIGAARAKNKRDELLRSKGRGKKKTKKKSSSK